MVGQHAIWNAECVFTVYSSYVMSCINKIVFWRNVYIPKTWMKMRTLLINYILNSIYQQRRFA